MYFPAAELALVICHTSDALHLLKNTHFIGGRVSEGYLTVPHDEIGCSEACEGYIPQDSRPWDSKDLATTAACSYSRSQKRPL